MNPAMLDVTAPDLCPLTLPDHIIFGNSAVMSRLRDLIDPISLVPIPVLIHGATGTGKEVLADYIHRRSPWKEGPFIKLSCAAIPGSLLEAELFGYERGAFTGATCAKPGTVELADRGTLLLDNVAELDISLQAKLLQFLQNGTFTRIGGQEQRSVTTRILCTANRSLEADVEQGSFREDLYHRISGATVAVPRLRERAEDIVLLSDFLLHKFAVHFQMQVRPLSSAISRRLRHYAWPGNIRELENVLRRYSLLGTATSITEALNVRSASFPALYLPLHDNSSLKLRTQRLVQQAEASAILQVLQQFDWNRTKSAQHLNISLRALLYKMRSSGISGYAALKDQN
jgi:two-component system response regulator AtoC